MANRNFNFNRNQDQTRHQITPLGAAIVEALPNRKKVAQLKRDFKRRGVCPSSALFTAEVAATWAAKAGGE
jgi:hypothetical protein